VSNPLHSTDNAGIAVALLLVLLISWPCAANRWKRRIRALGSPLIESPRYRILFLLVIVGILLISFVPEAVVLITAVDSLGLDIVTIMVAVELGRYLTSMGRLANVSALATECRRRFGQIRIRGALMLTRPALWPYACLSLLVIFWTFMRNLPRSQL
jgi:hypothetical protein